MVIDVRLVPDRFAAHLRFAVAAIVPAAAKLFSALQVIALVVAGLFAIDAVAIERAHAALSLQYKGFGYPAFYNHAYEDADSLQALAATGANSVELMIEFGIDVTHSKVVIDANYTESLAALGAAIDEAKSLGLTVMVRPLIDFLDPAVIGSYHVGDWRQTFQPGDVNAFFASYKQMIVAQAQLAKQHGAQMLSIGVELDQLAIAQYQSKWADIVTAVRGAFSGSVLYSASWSTASQVSFWNLMDYEAVDCYVPLSSLANPGLQDLVNGWLQPATASFNPNAYAVIGNQSPIDYFRGLAAQSGKPLLFSEIGYANDIGAAANPFAEGQTVAPQLQANLYQAFFTAWSQAGSTPLVGIFFWEWDPNSALSNVGPNQDTFSPQNSPAQTVVTNAFQTPTPQGPTSLLSAVLPSARSVTTGSVATAFGSIINVGSNPAIGCSVGKPSGFSSIFSYQTTNAGNQPIGAMNTPVDISVGGTQSFVFAITPQQDLNSVDAAVVFSCTNTAPAPTVSGLNTLLLSASATPSPDMISIGATPSGDGILTIPGATGSAFFSAATIDIGAGGQITAVVDDNGAGLAVTPLLCQSNPTTAACVNPPVPASSVNFAINARDVLTFSIFVTGRGNVPFDPAAHRLFLRFKTQDGIVRGATSVAVRTQ